MKKIVWAIALISVIYLVGIVVSGMGFNPTGIKWTFGNSGQFGDSFGPLSSLFACVAAVSAYLAYSEQRAELVRVEAAYTEEKARADKRDFENSFFHLLEMKRSALNAITVGASIGGASGAVAVEAIMEDVRASEQDADMLRVTYRGAYFRYRNMLSSYLRTCYHVMKFIDGSRIEDKKTYARIFRASLSNSEILLIGANAAVGGGAEKFKPLIEKYALLHNISATDARNYDLLPAFRKGAFGRRNIAEEIASGSDGVINAD